MKIVIATFFIFTLTLVAAPPSRAATNGRQDAGATLDAQQQALDAMARVEILAAQMAQIQQLQPLRQLTRSSGRSGEREDDLYDRGTSALDDDRLERALQAFDEVIKLNGRRADGALYWKAYIQNKQGQRDAALATLQTLKTSYPNSRWLEDGKALEVEVRQGAGQNVSAAGQPDDELVLLALNSLQNSDPEQAIPTLEKFLNSNRSPKLKERALFVLAQSRAPKAREVIGRFARGKANPDLQMRAIKYLGIFGAKDKENAQVLADIYQNSSDVDVKRAILRSFMLSRSNDRLLALAKSESNPELRSDAIRQLGLLRGQDELWQLYTTESNANLKEEILRSLFIGGNVDKLAEIAKTEKDPRLRRAAIHNLANLGKRAGDSLANLYAGEQDPDTRREIIRGLFIQGNCKALVDAARKESDPAMKKEIIQRLSLMRNCKEATDFMMEILNK